MPTALLHMRSSPPVLPQHRPHSLLRFETEAHLQAALETPYHVIVDSNVSSPTAEPVEAPFYHIVLSNRSALYFSVAHHISQALSRQLLLSETARIQIETTLHEAVLNAVIHGNLCIQNDYTGAESWSAHYETVGRKLALPQHRDQFICIEIHHLPFRLQILIHNQGEGFDYSSIRQSASGYSGRGLALIASIAQRLWFEDHGRTISYTLPLYQEPSNRVGLTQSDLPNRHHQARILLVDDSEFSCLLLHELFKKRGFSNVVVVHDGVEALKKIPHFEPDLILLDLMMPKMDGFEFCRELRRKPEYADIPILVQTAVEDVKTRNQVFQFGASDIVTKPVDADELIARSVVHLDRRMLLKDLWKNRLHIAHELEQSRQMQSQLMPSAELITQIRGRLQIGIAHHFETSAEIGGDFWGVRVLDDNHLAFHICDFSGHGVAAALNTFRLHALMQELIGTHGLEPQHFMTALNHRLYDLISRDQFCTLFYGVIDRTQDRLVYASAGAPAPVRWSASSGATLLPSCGLPVGVTPDAQYELREAAFHPTDALLFYSDVLTESANANRRCIHEEQIRALVEAEAPHAHIGSLEHHLLDTVLKQFRDHVGTMLSDDLTLNVYVRY